MSHFVVLVIGKNAEAQLAPYHEFECSGENDQYVQEIDKTDELLEAIQNDTENKTDAEKLNSALEYYGLEDKVVEDEIDADTEGNDCEHKYGYAVVKDGKLIKAIDRTNPNANWDWYEIGGRWTGWLKLKAGAKGKAGRPGLMTDAAKQGYADIMLKGSIDFEGMMNESGEKAGATWDKCRAFIGKKVWEKWPDVRKRFNDDMEKCREFYHAQPAIKALKESEAEEFRWRLDDDLMDSRESFVEAARNSAFIPYAVVKDGKWIAKGKMGWWGISDDTVEESAWDKQVTEMLMALPDDTRITVVDCHI